MFSTDMLYGIPFLEGIGKLLEQGGWVVWVLLVVAFVLWFFIAERLMFFAFRYPGIKRDVMQRWDAREDHSSWFSKGIRRKLLSETSQRINESIVWIKTLVVLCPLLGLLGTVTGMIDVFGVMAVFGTGNAREMASGVFKATLPTMAGMVVALSGIYFSAQIEAFAKRERRELEDELGSH